MWKVDLKIFFKEKLEKVWLCIFAGSRAVCRFS